MIESFRADSIIKRILKAVTFHAATIGGRGSSPGKVNLDLESEGVQSKSLSCCSFGRHILKPKGNAAQYFSTFEGIFTALILYLLPIILAF